MQTKRRLNQGEFLISTGVFRNKRPFGIDGLVISSVQLMYDENFVFAWVNEVHNEYIFHKYKKNGCVQ